MRPSFIHKSTKVVALYWVTALNMLFLTHVPKKLKNHTKTRIFDASLNIMYSIAVIYGNYVGVSYKMAFQPLGINFFNTERPRVIFTCC
jgi:hypothetical protein